MVGQNFKTTTFRDMRKETDLDFKINRIEKNENWIFDFNTNLRNNHYDNGTENNRK